MGWTFLNQASGTNISGLSDFSSPLQPLVDKAIIYDYSSSANRSISIRDLIQGSLTADSTGRAMMADGFLTVGKFADGALTADATGLAKVADGFLAATTAGRAKMADGYITEDKLGDNSVSASKLSAGVIQTVVSSTSSYQSGTVAIPTGSEPSYSNGTLISGISTEITLNSASNKVLLSFYVPVLSTNGVEFVSFAIFRDESLVAVGGRYSDASSYHGDFSLAAYDTPGSVGPHTYTVRYGTQSTTAVRLLGGGSVFWGGAGKIMLVAQEVK